MSSRSAELLAALRRTAGSASGWSLSARLAVLFAVSSSAVLISASVFLYFVFARATFADEVRLVSDQMNLLAEVLRRDATLTGPDGERIRWEFITVENSDFLLRVLDDRYGVVFETPGLESLLPGHVFPTPESDPFRTDSGVRVRHSQGRVYVAASRSVDTGDPVSPRRIVQLAYDGTEEARLLGKYRDQALVAIGLGSSTFVLLAFWVTRRGLRPLEEITLAAQQVSAQRLDQRIGPRPWPRELSALAAAFDGMLARLEQSVSRLSRFSADLAHELRTPLNNLIGEAEVSLSRNRSADEYRETIESSLEECGRLARVTEELLFLARTEGDEVRIDLQPVELREVAEDVSTLYEAVVEERGIELACRGAAVVEASPTLLRRALINLVSNAVKFTAPGGSIEISIEPGADAASIAVSDDGCGIPDEHVPHVFDRFYRVDSARSRDPDGTGLGLAIVKSIVDLHGGRIEVESRVQRGTRVTLRLPTLAVRRAAGRPTEPAGEGDSARSRASRWRPSRRLWRTREGESARAGRASAS